jgi:hypothetical protein
MMLQWLYVYIVYDNVGPSAILNTLRWEPLLPSMDGLSLIESSILSLDPTGSGSQQKHIVRIQSLEDPHYWVTWPSCILS